MMMTHSIHGTGIFTYIYHKNQPNVGIYTIHGSYGWWWYLPHRRIWDHPREVQLRITHYLDDPSTNEKPSESVGDDFREGEKSQRCVLFHHGYSQKNTTTHIAPFPGNQGQIDHGLWKPLVFFEWGRRLITAISERGSRGIGRLVD